MNRSGITVIAAVASCMLVGGVHGQGQGQWAFGDSILSDQGDRIHAAMDGDLLVCGSEIVTRVDGASSAVEWRRRVEGFYPQDVIEASDGRVVAVGLWIDSAGGQGIAMIFFDALGNHVGHRVFPGRAGGEHHEVIETANGGFLIAAEELSSTGGLRPLLIRTDVAGDLQWCRRYDMPDFPFGEGEFCDVEETRLDDGRSIFHLTGRFREDSLQKHDTLMATVDDAGDPIASSTLGFTGFTDFGRGLRLLSDGYLVTGYSKEIGEGGGTYLMRLASDFSLQWYRTLQEFSGTKAIDLTTDGMVRMPGTSSFPDPIRGAAIIEIPFAAPNSAAGVRYGGVVVDDGFEFAPEAGGGYALIGRTLSYGTVQADVYLVRTDADLLSGCEEASYEVVVSPDQIPGRELKLLPVPLRMPRQPEMDPQVEDWFEVTICEDDPAGPCADPPIEMVGWWTMDELAGTIAADSMSGLDGVHVNGPQIVSGMVGNAIDLDGLDDHLRIGPDPLLGLDAAAQPTGDITVDAWIRIDSNGPMEWGPVMSVAGSCAGW
ncbi:MAG: hypothetical protein GY895_16165, partial [Phycisphaera sp.]|nr:hypothetical protein [Phycisphaera sp.]